jgi:hypothetical protein
VGPRQFLWFNEIHVRNNPFSTLPPLNGQVQLQLSCCLDMVSRTPVTPSGLSLQIVPSPGCQFAHFGSDELFQLICPVANRVVPVDVTPATPGLAYLLVATSSNVTPGGFIATLIADSAVGRSSQEIFINVLSGKWPADGPLLPCKTAVPMISLGSLDPPAWKVKNPNQTTFSVAVSFVSNPRKGGLQFTVVDSGSTKPLPQNTATVTFKNTKGWPVAMETVDRRNCSSAGQLVVVPEGSTATISISRATTTTLVFSKSTCRAWNDWFDCWGRSALGLDEIITFSEGPFWELFGGRRVDIETVGDWGSIPTPDSTAVIRTP